MDRARLADAVADAVAVDAVAVDATDGVVVDAADADADADAVVDPLAEEIRQSLFLLLGALGLMGLVAVALLVLTTGSGG